MANSRQARKRVKQIAQRTKVNKARLSRIRTFIRNVEAAIDAKEGADASKALRIAQSEIMRGVRKGVIHQNTASRKVSRLAKQVKVVNS